MNYKLELNKMWFLMSYAKQMKFCIKIISWKKKLKNPII